MAASSSERDSLPRMPFLQHLEALRSVLITALVVVGVGTLVAWPFAGRLLDFVIRLLPDDMPAHVFAPAEAFLIRLKVSAAAGLFAGAPIVLWKVWSFLAPALYRAERRRVSALWSCWRREHPRRRLTRCWRCHVRAPVTRRARTGLGCRHTL